MNCVRTPPLVRQDWARQYGLDGIDTPEFERYIDEVEKRLQANQQTAYFNAQNLRMREGCQKLGYLSKQTFVNWDPKIFQPLMAGYTGFGDQTGGKQTARRTYLLDAYQNGAQIIVHCRADRILVESGRAAGVAATYSDPQGRSAKLTIRAPQVVAAGGSLETPALLLRSGIGGPNVGKFFRVQPGGAVYGVYKEKQKGWWGSPMTTNCEQFTDTGDGFGFYMEIPAFGPGFVASVIPWVNGRQHKEMMTKVPYISTFIWFLRDKGHGQITIDESGNSVATYQLSDEADQKNFHHATAEAIRIHKAAGAQEILVSLAHQQLIWRRGQNLESYIQTVIRQPIINGAQPMISAHQLCSCRMGNDPAISVADTNGELRDVKGVWIGDGSACPTSLGANPMVTIMALAHRTADRMAASSRRYSNAIPGVGWSSPRPEGPTMPDNRSSNSSTYATSGPRSEDGANEPQFANILELSTRPGRARRVIQIISDQAIQRIIQPSQGFIDWIVLFALEEADHVTALSFWENQNAYDRFNSDGLDRVIDLLRDDLTAPPQRRPFYVGASTNSRIRGWTRAPSSSNRWTDTMAGATRQILDAMPGGGSALSGQNVNVVTNMAGNMMRGMVSLMNPWNMMREMAGIMTNPLNMFSLGQRMLTGTVGRPTRDIDAGTSSAYNTINTTTQRDQSRGRAPVLQFAHVIELTTTPGRGRRAVDIIGEQAIPNIIQPADGFIDEIVLLSLTDPNHVTAISFWENKEVSDRFDRYGLDQVSALLTDVLAGRPQYRPFNVGASTNPNILGWSQ